MKEWKPARIVRLVRVLNTSTKPIVVDTDDGLALMKYVGNVQGTDALLAEFLAGSLARKLDLPVPNFSLLHIDGYGDAGLGVNVRAGTAFLSQWYSQAMTFSGSGSL